MVKLTNNKNIIKTSLFPRSEKFMLSSITVGFP